MSKPTNTKVPNPTNPSSLKPRYEIRKLTDEHADWAAAIVCHSNGFHSPVWPLLYSHDITTRVHDMFAACSYLVSHQIASGMSFGVFDTEYTYKTSEAKASGGKLYWDKTEPREQTLAAEGARLLQQMDFPLVSVALSYDAFNALDMAKMGPLVATLPHFGLVYQILGSGDTRDPATWQPTGPGQVLFRNATSTRHDYEGQGIMGGLARWLMREAEGRGFRGVQIECLSDAVTHVWSQPQSPYKGFVVSEFDMATWRDEEGKLAFEPSTQRAAKCYVELKPKA
jgi:hypothetical protein